ncbi:pyroglutamyl peptidase-like protein type I [Amylocarpus encephaloides]|uniref:Pyroglutamyl peptidase-like protein type I n=1 Tax=Amylocarpus encephaloides TaxID=45428 RepID=A0A9P7YIE5_9HELO|nr:pyroglutamyl peptidase-like protein type I [Amylocarpus encephaloides]
MGSQGGEQIIQDDEIIVLVTGFAPFRSQYPVNPAWEIASRLPPFLPPPPSNTSTISSVTALPPVRLVVYPNPVKVSYDIVRELVPKLWDTGGRVDYMVHIGMASGRKFYSVERRGHRDGYHGRDVDQKLLNDEERRFRGDDKWIWSGMPEELLSSIAVDDVWRRWRTALPETDVRVSEDAGRYLCDFMYFSSLAHLTKKEEDRRVTFFHVPVEADEASIDTGVEVAIELIRAIVQSGRMKDILRNRLE